MNDKQLFLDLVLQNQGIIYKICKVYRHSHEDQEDLFQEIVYQLWKSFGQFQGRSKITTWMYRIGVNTAIADFRKPSIKQTTLEDSIQFEATLESDSEKTEELYKAIRKLNESDRAVLSAYFEDLSYSEIGQVLGISENSVGIRLTRIKKKLKAILNL